MDGEARMVDVREPRIIRNYLPEDRLRKIVETVNTFPISSWGWDSSFERYTFYHPYLDKLSMFEMDRAREEFDNDELLFTYSLLSYYNSPKSNLSKHKDDNACTYTIDLCLRTKKPWPLVVEGKEYLLNTNDALLFYGEDQLHWREPMGEDNSVLLFFMHFADRNHWWFQANNKDCV